MTGLTKGLAVSLAAIWTMGCGSTGTDRLIAEEAEAENGNGEVAEQDVNGLIRLTDEEKEALGDYVADAENLEFAGEVTVTFDAPSLGTVTETWKGIAAQQQENLFGGDVAEWTFVIAWHEIDPTTGDFDQLIGVHFDDLTDPGTASLVDTAQDVGDWAVYTDVEDVTTYMSAGGTFEIAAVSFDSSVPCSFAVPGYDCVTSQGTLTGSLDMSTHTLEGVILTIAGPGIPGPSAPGTPAGIADLDVTADLSVPVTRDTTTSLY